MTAEWGSGDKKRGKREAEKGLTQSTRDAEKGRSRKQGTWMGRMGRMDRMKAGMISLEPEAEAPGPVEVVARVEGIAGTEVVMR
jgi:hypothetical protein